MKTVTHALLDLKHNSTHQLLLKRPQLSYRTARIAHLVDGACLMSHYEDGHVRLTGPETQFNTPASIEKASALVSHSTSHPKWHLAEVSASDTAFSASARDLGTELGDLDTFRSRKNKHWLRNPVIK